MSQPLYTTKDLAPLVGVQFETISRHAKRLGLKPLSPKTGYRFTRLEASGILESFGLNGNVFGCGWHESEVWTLVNMLEDGHSYAEIAQVLGRSYHSVRGQAQQHDLLVWSQTGLYSRRDLTEQFFTGIYMRNITEWIKKGWLKAIEVAKSPSGEKHKGIYRITQDGVLDFLQNEAAYMAWQPYMIRDKGIRFWATELRSGLSWEWLTSNAIAKRDFTARQKRNQAMPQGFLPKRHTLCRCLVGTIW